MVGSGSNHWEFCEGEPRFQNTIPKKGWVWTQRKETQWVSHPSCLFLLLVDLLTVTHASPPAYEHSLLPGHSLSLCGSSAQAPKSSSISSSFLKCVFAPRLALVSLPVPQISTLCASLHLCEALFLDPLPAHSPAT